MQAGKLIAGINRIRESRVVRYLLYAITFLLVLPGLMVIATISALLSPPGLFAEEGLSGNGIALLYAMAAVVLVVGVLRFPKRPAPAIGKQLGTAMVGVIFASLICLAILGVIGWFVFTTIMSGWCNPRC